MQNFVNVFGISVFREEQTSKVVVTLVKFLCKNTCDGNTDGTSLDTLENVAK